MELDLSRGKASVTALYDSKNKILTFTGGDAKQVFGCTVDELYEEQKNNGLKGQLAGIAPYLYAGGCGACTFASPDGEIYLLITVCHADLTADGLLCCAFYTPEYAASRLGVFSELASVGILVFDLETLKILDINDYLINKLKIDRSECNSVKRIFTAESLERILDCFANQDSRRFAKEVRLFTDGIPMRYDIAAVRRPDGAINCLISEKTVNLLYGKYLSDCNASLAKASGAVAGGTFELCVYGDGSISVENGTDTVMPDLCDKEKNGEWHQKLNKNFTGDNFSFISNCRYKNGNECRMQFDFYLLDESMGIRKFLVFYSDASDNAVTLLRYREMQERLEMLLEHSNDIAFSYDYKTDVLKYTDRDVLAEGKKQIVIENAYGKGWYDNVFIEDEFSAKDFINGKVYDGLQIRMRMPDGNEYWYSMKNRIVTDSEGNRRSTVGTLHDITEEKKAQFELADQMKRDSMTGFLNKEAFAEETEKLYEALERKGKSAVMVCARIANLSQLNENVGVLFGDTVLKNLAAQFHDLFKDNIVGRTGGNTLSVFMEKTDETDEKLQRLRNNFLSIFYNVSDDSQPVLVLGAACSERGDDTDKLLFKVRLALLAAEKSGLPYEEYSPDMDFLSPAENEAQGVENAPSISVSMDSVTTEMCKVLISAADTDAAINSILALSGHRYRIKRAYVFERTENPDILYNSYEWCAEGVKPLKSQLQNVRIEDEEAMNELFAKDIFCGHDIPLQKRAFPSLKIMDDSEEASFEKLQFPIRSNGSIFGFIGFDSYSVSNGRSKPDIEQLTMLSGFLGTQIVHLRTQRQKWSEHQIFRSVIDHMHLSVYTVDPDNYDLLYSKWYDKCENTCGGKCYSVLKGRNSPCANCPIQGLSVGSDSYCTCAFNQETNSWQDITAFRTKDIFDRDVALVSCHDITDYNEQMAETDTLTSTPNFGVFVARAEGLLHSNSDSHFAVMYLNCRKLRVINESFGYSTGNKLLIATAGAIMNGVGQRGICSRISADKFVIIQKTESSISPELVERKIEELRSAVYRRLDGKLDAAYINFCVGIFEPDSKSRLELTVEDMLDKSCTAAKAAEAMGKSIYIYDNALRAREARIASIEASMESAAENDEFQLYLQPKFSLSTQKLKGAEALVRWITNDGRCIMPNDFIPIFEQNCFITKLDFIMYEKTMQVMKKWIDDGKEPPIISVNVSRVHISDEQFTSKLIVLTEKYGIPRNKIELELTETMLMNDEGRMLDFIDELHNNNFLISIDDFGSGYSALNMLKDMNIDILKLDKSLLSKNHNQKEKLLIEGIVSIARKLNMLTVCEGVETVDQAKFLSGINCDYAQGYLYERPIPIADFESKYIYGEYLGNTCRCAAIPS